MIYNRASSLLENLIVRIAKVHVAGASVTGFRGIEGCELALFGRVELDVDKIEEGPSEGVAEDHHEKQADVESHGDEHKKVSERELTREDDRLRGDHKGFP